MVYYWILFAFFMLKVSSVPPPALEKIAPIADCGGDEGASESTKYYKESCSNDTDCFGGPSTMLCKDKTCQCADNYIPEKRFVGEKATQTVCVSAPALFSKCKTDCQKPSTCLPYTGEDAKGKGIKVCLCAKPYVLQDGACILSCSNGQYYDSSKYKCLQICKSTEIQINGTCLPLVGLEAKCQTHEQCQPVYSACNSGICTCWEGFTAAKKLGCLPTEFNCPSGNALKSAGKNYTPCTVTFSDSAEDDEDDSGAKKSSFVPGPLIRKYRKDDCPKDYYCSVSPAENYKESERTGFCCPAFKNKCRVGAPHPTAKCTQAADVNYCPWQTHYCQEVTLGGAIKQLCCPERCSSDLMSIADQCYQEAKLGDECVADRQCSDSLTKCIKGVCQCQPGAKVRGIPPITYCTKDCNSDEILINNICEKRLKLSDICVKDKEYRCPEYSLCNKNKQCACSCGMFTIADNVCAPPPICNRPSYPIYKATAAGDSGAAAPPPPVPRISDEDRSKLLKNATFCQVKDKIPPLGLKIGKCSDKEYCSRYITNVGLCCPKPTRECAGGDKPKSDQLCDVKEHFSCGLDFTCTKQVFPVDQDENSKENTVCCPVPQIDEPYV